MPKAKFPQARGARLKQDGRTAVIAWKRNREGETYGEVRDDPSWWIRIVPRRGLNGAVGWFLRVEKRTARGKCALEWPSTWVQIEGVACKGWAELSTMKHAKLLAAVVIEQQPKDPGVP